MSRLIEVVVEELAALASGEVGGQERALVDDAVEVDAEAEVPRHALVDGEVAVGLGADEVRAREAEDAEGAEPEDGDGDDGEQDR